MHPDAKGLEIRIELSGSRRIDYNRAREILKKKLGLGKNDDFPEDGYVWHHFDDITEENGKLYASMQLVEQEAHGGTNVNGMAHSGSVAQYKSIKGSGYE